MRYKTIMLCLSSLCISPYIFAKASLDSNVIKNVKAGLSNKVLTHDEIMQGVEKTQNLYFSCLSETAEAIKSNFSQANKEMIFTVVNATCEYPEDLFSTYSVLLASSNMNIPMSEKQAYAYIETAYEKQGREKTNQDIRTKILKSLKIIPE